MAVSIVQGTRPLDFPLPVHVSVLRGPITNTWAPNPLALSMLPGTTANASVTGVFTAPFSILVDAVAVVRGESGHLTVVPGPLPQPIISGQSFTLALTLTIDANAVPSTYGAQVEVRTAQGNVGNPLVIAVSVPRPTKERVAWTPPALATSLVPGQSVHLAASFTSTLPITAAAIAVRPNNTALMVSATSLPAVIAANTPVPITFTVELVASAQAAHYAATAWIVIGGPRGTDAAGHRRHQSLHTADEHVDARPESSSPWPRARRPRSTWAASSRPACPSLTRQRSCCGATTT